MVFGITKDDSIIHKEIGQGYISINDVLDGYEFPWVILPGTRKKICRDLRSSELASTVTEATMQISVAASAIGR